jgi:hypothetical protein
MADGEIVMEAKGENLSESAIGFGSGAGAVSRVARARAPAPSTHIDDNGNGEGTVAAPAAPAGSRADWAADTFLENLLRSLASPEEEVGRTESTLLRIKMAGRG